MEKGSDVHDPKTDSAPCGAGSRNGLGNAEHVFRLPVKSSQHAHILRRMRDEPTEVVSQFLEAFDVHVQDRHFHEHLASADIQPLDDPPEHFEISGACRDNESIRRLVRHHLYRSFKFPWNALRVRSRPRSRQRPGGQRGDELGHFLGIGVL
jgi:hypothetical protein